MCLFFFLKCSRHSFSFGFWCFVVFFFVFFCCFFFFGGFCRWAGDATGSAAMCVDRFVSCLLSWLVVCACFVLFWFRSPFFLRHDPDGVAWPAAPPLSSCSTTLHLCFAQSFVFRMSEQMDVRLCVCACVRKKTRWLDKVKEWAWVGRL